jgi:hypothetical protein
VKQDGIVLSLQRLAWARTDWEGMAEDRLDPTNRSDSEVGDYRTLLSLHDVVDKFRIHSFAVGWPSVFQPRYATSVTIACLASFEGFHGRAVLACRTDYDYAHIVSFLSWFGLD